MTRPIVKICGVSQEEEVQGLMQLGVDFFGLVVDMPLPWAVSLQRAKQLAACGNARTRATLITRPTTTGQLQRLIRETAVKAVQLSFWATPDYVRRLRRVFHREDLAILQEIPYRDGRFLNDDQVDQYLASGADVLLIDLFEKTHASSDSARDCIPIKALEAFRARHPGKPFLVAGGVSADNARSLLAASGAVGIDVCSAVRRNGLIQRELVARLLSQLVQDQPASKKSPRPSLRALLSAVASGNQLIAYLTIGDPADRFLQVAEEAFNAGALTLELGFPTPTPREGAVLTASHRRALEAGVDTPRAIALFAAVAQALPKTPLIAVVHWAALKSEAEQDRFLDALAEAGAAAVLPVGLSPWQYPAFASRTDQRGMETVIPCAPTASPKLRALALRYCSGCLYVPRARLTGSAQGLPIPADFCRRVSEETDIPMIVGIGVETPQDVAAICRTPAKAAAVGSALVEHLRKGGSADQMVRWLLSQA